MFLLASLKAEEGAATGGLRGIQVMAPGARQARVVELGDEGMLGEGLGQRDSGWHPQHSAEARQVQNTRLVWNDGAK